MLCNIEAEILAEMAIGILKNSNQELASRGVSPALFPDALEARSDFFAACIKDKSIDGIGFTDSHDFPIPRSSFPERALPVERKKDDDEPAMWQVVIENVYVNSPNWDKEDQTYRKWKAKDSTRRDCYFTIEDEEFWLRVKRKSLAVDVLDQLKVQWAFRWNKGQIVNRRVLRVLEFNGAKLAEPLSDEGLKAILGDINSEAGRRGEPDLFSR